MGIFEAKVIWGFLEESEFYDQNELNDHGWISGMYLAWKPKFLPDFMISTNYQYYSPLNDWKLLDIVKFTPFIREKNSGTDPNDVLVSIAFEWKIYEVGLDIYGEWGRNDNFASLEGFFTSPEHTQGYTLGFIYNILEKQEIKYFVSAELTNLEQTRTVLARPAGPWYRHGWAGWTQGYTNLGQVLGVGIGPGSNSQRIVFSRISNSSKVDVFLQRIAHDKDYYYSIESMGFDTIDYVEAILGMETIFFLKTIDVYGNFTYSYSLNYNFIADNDLSNLHIELGIRLRI